MNRVLVLGGYGGFGARLARRMAADGWSVIVAGRDITKARTLAAALPGAEAVRADRTGDLKPVLAGVRPDLLVDCAGPFQGNDYRVPRTCIAAGVHYIDLADAREFVCGVGELDGAARAAGVAVLAGGSTVPALTGAVLRGLAAPLDRVDAVDIALGASTAATGGGSISRAVLSYAGKPIRIWRGRRWIEAAGMHELEQRVFRVTGRAPMKRWVALADVPDLKLVPENLPGSPATSFRAGNESLFQLLVARALAGIVRRRWLGSLTQLESILLPLQRAMAHIGSTRSAMAVEVRGWRDNTALLRRWTVIADRGNGPEIPVLAAQLIARQLRDGTLGPGARDTSTLFDLEDFVPLLAELDAVTQIDHEPLVPVYRQALGKDYDRLPGPVRQMHAIIGDGGAEGEGVVEGGASPLARMAGRVVGFPPAGTYPVHVAFTERDGIETWTRSFGPHTFYSCLRAVGDTVEERFGPFRFRFAIPADAAGLAMELVRWNALGLPLPRWLAPRIVATERADGTEFLFNVAIALPVIGPVIRYRGRLRRI